jgi:hypothetical protein
MEATASALSPPGSKEKEFNILDICMAPGVFTAAALKHHSHAKCFGNTLPIKQGSHAVLLPPGKTERIMELDVTMLQELAGGKPIAKTHPDYAKFDSRMPFKHYPIYLIFCDGVVLQTHKRPEHRQEIRIEVTKLVTSQLILAKKRIREGGTIITLLHKLNSYNTANILYTFSGFSSLLHI